MAGVTVWAQTTGIPTIASSRIRTPPSTLVRTEALSPRAKSTVNADWYADPAWSTLERRTLLAFAMVVGGGAFDALAQRPASIDPGAVTEALAIYWQSRLATLSPNQAAAELAAWKTPAYWMGVPALRAIAPQAAARVQALEAEILARARVIGWPLQTQAPADLVTLINRQAIAWSLTRKMTLSPGTARDTFLQQWLPFIFEEHLFIAARLNAKRTAQRQAGAALERAPSGFFLQAPLAAALRHLPADARPLAAPLQNFMSTLVKAYGGQTITAVDAGVVGALNRGLLRLHTCLFFGIFTQPTGVSVFLARLFRLTNSQEIRIGEELFRSHEAALLWEHTPGLNTPTAGAFEILGTHETALVTAVVDREIQITWAMRQSPAAQAQRMSQLPYWDPAIKTLIDRAFPERTLPEMRAAARRHIILHELFHRWFGSHRTIDANSPLMTYFGAQLAPTERPIDLVNEYLAYMGTVAESDKAPWEITRWVAFLEESDPRPQRKPSGPHLLFSKMIADLIGSLVGNHPALRGIVPPNGFLTRRDGLAFLRAITTIPLSDIQAAGENAYRRNFGALMPRPRFPGISRGMMPFIAPIVGYLKASTPSPRTGRAARPIRQEA